MILTALQKTNFFTAGVQMDLTSDQQTSLAAEGLVTEADFIDFKIDKLQTTFKICGPSFMAQLNAADDKIVYAVPAIKSIPGVQAIPVPARSASRIIAALIVWNYYHDTSRASTTNNMHFQSTLCNFKTEWDTIIILSKQD